MPLMKYLLVMDRKFITIKFGSQNKKIAVEEINYRTILGIVKERFTVKSPDIKYFDTDVDDWVDFDIDSDEYVSEVKVLKLIVNEKDVAETDDIQISADKDQPSTPTHTHMLDSQLQRPGMPISTPSRSSTPTRPLTPSSSSSSRPLTPLSSSSSSSRPLTPSTSTSATTSSDNASKCSARTAEYYTNNKLWCRQYKIPRSSISRSVLVKLESKDELTTAERRNMLDGVYNDVTRYSGGMYPTSEMYEDIVDGLMREYPYLLTYRDLPPAAAREFWKDKIIYKFGNARKVLDKDHPDVKLRKKNVAGNTEKKAEEITTFTWGLAKYLPELPVTEDDTSFEIHIKWLQREFKKTDPDTDGVDTKMQLTFPYRRKLVVEEKISVTDLLEQFPWLTSRHELLKEFERLEPNTVSKNLVELLTDGLQKYRKAIVSLLKKKKKPDFLSEIDQASRHFRAEGQRNYADDCMALAGIPLLFKEKPDTLMCKGEGVPMGIKINSQMMTMDDNSFSVYAEETEVFKCDSFFEAYSGLLACIYVMNLAYPKGLDKTFSFVQNILLGLRDDTSKNTVDRRIVNVLSLLNAEIKKS